MMKLDEYDVRQKMIERQRIRFYWSTGCLVSGSLVAILWLKFDGNFYNPSKSNQFSDGISASEDIRESLYNMRWPLNMHAEQNPEADALIPQEGRNPGNYHVGQERVQIDHSAN